MTAKTLVVRYNKKYRTAVSESLAEHFLENHLLDLLDLKTNEILEEFDKYLSEIKIYY